MFGRRRRAAVTRDEVEDPGDAVENAMLLCEHTALVERDPCALIFAISALDLLMDAFLYLPFEDSCSCRFIEACNFQNVSGIDPVVRSASHDMVGGDLEFIHRHLRSHVSGSSGHKSLRNEAAYVTIGS